MAKKQTVRSFSGLDKEAKSRVRGYVALYATLPASVLSNDLGLSAETIAAIKANLKRS